MRALVKTFAFDAPLRPAVAVFLLKRGISKRPLSLSTDLGALNAELAFEKRFIDERKRRLERERDDFEREKLLFEHRKANEQ